MTSVSIFCIVFNTVIFSTVIAQVTNPVNAAGLIYTCSSFCIIGLVILINKLHHKNHSGRNSSAVELSSQPFNHTYDFPDQDRLLAHTNILNLIRSSSIRGVCTENPSYVDSNLYNVLDRSNEDKLVSPYAVSDLY